MSEARRRRSPAALLGTRWVRRVEGALAGSCVLAVVLALALVGHDAAGIGRWWPVLAAFGVAVALGELARLELPELVGAAPAVTACGLGLVFTGVVGQTHDLTCGASLVVLVVALAMGVGSGIARLLGRGGVDLRVGARFLALAAAAVTYRAVPVGGRTLVQWQSSDLTDRWRTAVGMLVVTILAVLLEVVLVTVVLAAERRSPLGPALRDQVPRGTLALSALGATGALIALAELVIGLAAIPAFLTPLLVTLGVTGRYADVRRTYRETLHQLSRLPEASGFSRPGHAERVAETSVAIGTELGLGQGELLTLERAALVHDLGLVSFADPVPEGRTVEATPGDQVLIASEGVRILTESDVLTLEATVLLAQATPFHVMRGGAETIPMSGRILRVANAFDDHLPQPATEEGLDRALERLHLGLGYEYDPAVVEALSRVLDRG